MINQNTRVTQEIKGGLGLSEITGYPRKVADAIIPVLPVNKKYCNIVKSADATGTLYTTPADKDFYLIAANISAEGSAGADGRTHITVTVGGVATQILNTYVDSAVGTQNTATNNLSLSVPLKIDRGTAIICTVVGGFACIIGYTEDVTGE